MPNNIYDYLDGEPSEESKRSLFLAYSKIPKVAKTTANNPKDALGHLFIRSLGRGIETSSLIKMFGANPRNYVFEIPERWHRDVDRREIPFSAVDRFQEMDLAIEIARVREIAGGDPIDYYVEAVRLLRTR